MNTREQFGKYLLLKKLTEDPMGETFRAGLLGSKGMERVALLRIFNGQGLDGQRLWQAVDSRSVVQEALKSPNIGEGIEMGEIEGIPYVAYDYVSGKNMAKLLEQAAKKRNFVPAEHALLITERIALALASAAETRVGGERILHGFLVPHLAILSNEGETRLLGFEYGPGLRSFAQNPVIRQHFGRYLAPEALRGDAPHPLDDIYSLGVILYELLTGRPLPPPAQDGFNSVIDQGVVATEGTPIPAELGALLKQSLVPRDHRIKDVATWHKTLNKYMFEGQYNPTTFNLAFFMHNLFRQEIERESQEIEVEKTLPVPTVQDRKELTGTGVVEAPPVPAQAPAGEGTAAGEKTENFIPEYAKDEKKSNTGLIVGGIAAALIAVAGAAYFMGGGEKEAAAPPPVQQAAPVPQKPAEPEYTGPSEEDIKAQIAELVGQQSNLLKQQYDDKLKELENQLQTARKEEEARKERRAEEERQRIAAEEEAVRLEEEQKQAELAEAEKAAEEAKQKEAEAAAAKQQEAEAEAAKAAAAVEKAAQVPATTPKAVEKPAAPQVRRGDLVELGPGVKPPVATRPVKPRYPDMARRFNKNRATVVVKVLIDENGKVLKTELAGKPQKFGFDSEALQAAKRSQWKPATKNGVPVKVWHTLSIEFRN